MGGVACQVVLVLVGKQPRPHKHAKPPSFHLGDKKDAVEAVISKFEEKAKRLILSRNEAVHPRSIDELGNSIARALLDLEMLGRPAPTNPQDEFALQVLENYAVLIAIVS